MKGGAQMFRDEMGHREDRGVAKTVFQALVHDDLIDLWMVS